ncbi:hypothetical protein EWM64_g9832 [Hericium alpestre]|uniref:Uncharacterized protein n=1 Tax=Hericium alpestre TaxID=135208 RepID=A0A4Y9ZL78_9AGAM|nr:hypothetical protein EWM64_g9832 [Hericium alpestre]
MPCQTASPFASSRVPTELLSAIFDFALPDSPRLTTSASLTEAPTVLTHVCARWRAVAHSTPSLWANVSIALYGHARPPKARHLSIKRKKFARMSTGVSPMEPKPMPHDIQLATFIAWLARSKASPLTVALHNVHASHPTCAAFLAALCAHAARWRAIDIVGVPLDLFPVLPPTLPLLETLTINSYGSAAHHNSALARAFVRAPRLRAVSVRSAALPTWHFPWAQLTALALVEFDAPRPTDAPSPEITPSSIPCTRPRLTKRVLLVLPARPQAEAPVVLAHAAVDAVAEALVHADRDLVRAAHEEVDEEAAVDVI